MHNSLSRTISGLVVGAAIASCIGLASPRAFAQAASAPVAMQGVTYLTGGIGEDDVKQLRAAAAKYDLRVTFASKTGAYLSDIDVSISTESKREVLSIRTEGPLLFVNVPPGRYLLAANYAGKAQTKHVTVPPKGAVEIVLRWDDADAGSASGATVQH
ncbi:carboxypeptidase regulatory-like domain-containing protein [Trinickia sp. Y13]|uniref:carboxypeptidase regulatory-like domain-containing protein n=1 Tax=Trinickia sp. Y13 TaxID=2917807 RepID=UPI00240666E2|nr:carboxypeptidase regulatory-like domain-containing protein [Trinickia sp. Y13]MDG0025396.1 carboxypeptidase regulatory-like domain-containing protein [Trinickia sp. Y13]